MGKIIDTLAQELFNEFVQWYSNLVEQNGRIPRAISGVSVSGQQFIFILDGLHLNQVERNKLVKQALAEEGAMVFAYGSLLAAYDEDTDQTTEELSITAGTSTNFIQGKWSVLRDNNGTPHLQHVKTISADDPQKYPTTWFLTSSNALSKIDEKRFGQLWKTLRKDAQFRKRG